MVYGHKIYAMKNIMFTLFVSFSFFASAQVGFKRKIQLVILFDTSNSMDGLINQAKSKIWTIVNQAGQLKCEGQSPLLEIALYDYGNQSLDARSQFIRLQTNFTNDLDLISSKLFGLSTNGGDEFCGAVIQKSMDELTWSSDKKDLKMIFIAGNEPFNQGPVAFKEACASAKSRGVTVSTIYCGDYQQGIREFWQDGATCSGGDYFNINSDQAISYIASPYDDQIKNLNSELNGTYISFGRDGLTKKKDQIEQDKNAESMNEAVLVERAMAKGNAYYWNGSWDLVDATTADSTRLDDLKEEELPAELKGKSKDEMNAFLVQKKADRQRIQNEIGTLSTQRDAYITDERKKTNSNEKDGFAESVNKSIQKFAISLGFE